MHRFTPEASERFTQAWVMFLFTYSWSTHAFLCSPFVLQLDEACLFLSLNLGVIAPNLSDAKHRDDGIGALVQSNRTGWLMSQFTPEQLSRLALFKSLFMNQFLNAALNTFWASASLRQNPKSLIFLCSLWIYLCSTHSQICSWSGAGTSLIPFTSGFISK